MSQRAEQLKALGIAESDIGTDIIEGVPKKLPQIAPKKQPEKHEEFKFEAITAETLKHEKGYNKSLKKHQKELEALKKKHLKEKSLIQKSQCMAIDKLCKTKGKPNLTGEVSLKDMCTEQTEQYTELVERHKKEVNYRPVTFFKIYPFNLQNSELRTDNISMYKAIMLECRGVW